MRKRPIIETQQSKNIRLKTNIQIIDTNRGIPSVQDSPANHNRRTSLKVVQSGRALLGCLPPRHL